MSIIEFNKLKEKQLLQKELKEWQERLKLAYEFDWKDPSKAICHSEVKKLKELIEPETIIDKILKEWHKTGQLDTNVENVQDQQAHIHLDVILLIVQ